MTTKLFRQEVIEANRNRLTGVVIAATPPSARIYTIIAVGLTTILILFLSFGEYSTKVQIQGVVTHSEGIARVMPPESAEVREVQVEEGQSVNEGDPLLTISISQGRDATGEGMTGRLAEIERQDRELERQEQLAETLGDSEVGGFANQKTNLANAIDSLQRQSELKRKQVDLAESDYSRAKRLSKEGAGTQRQVEETQSEIIARKLELENLNERVISEQETLLSLDAQRSTSMIGAVRSKSEISAQRAALAEQKLGLLRQDKLVLTAPISGTIGDIAVRPGQRTQPTSAAVTVIPKNSKLEVQLYAPSRAIGFVKPGQDVRLLFDAFPYQKYGSGHGTVTWVSQVPTDPVGIEQTASGVPLFRIRVRLDDDGFSDRIAQQPLRGGMTLQANLLLEKRNLWEVFFEPILKAVRK